MSHCPLHIGDMLKPEPSLSDLAELSGIEPRTIRSWVAQGLLPAPITRGPTARYPAGTTETLLAIRTMRDTLGMTLADIRRELLIASPEQVADYAERASASPPPKSKQPSSALAYLQALRGKPAEATKPEPLPAAKRGFEALAENLGRDRAEPPRKARAEDWLRIPITPDAEFHVRGPLDAEQTARLERCADLIRNILLGRNS